MSETARRRARLETTFSSRVTRLARRMHQHLCMIKRCSSTRTHFPLITSCTTLIYGGLVQGLLHQWNADASTFYTIGEKRSREKSSRRRVVRAFVPNEPRPIRFYEVNL